MRGSRPSSKALLLLLAAALIVTGVAVASIPGAGGVIAACYGPSGLLRVVAEPDECRETETPLSWNEVGPQGAQGEQGEAGTAEAYARIAADGSVDPAFSRGITQANVTHPQTGVYCLRGLAFQPRVALGNGPAQIRIEPDGTITPVRFDTIVTTAVLDIANPGFFLGFCDPGPEAVSQVRIYVATPATGLVDRTFTILLDD